MDISNLWAIYGYYIDNIWGSKQGLLCVGVE
jgi:hypothetical protein